MRQRDIRDGRVEQFHERRHCHDHGDDPGIHRARAGERPGERSLADRTGRAHRGFSSGVAETLTSGTTESPGVNAFSTWGGSSKTIFTGTRCTTFT